MENTKHLDLKQWELEDFILMEDFNADNRKVDAAFAALQEEQQQVAEDLQQLQQNLPLVKLGSTVGSGTDRLEIDLSGADLTAYSRLYVHISGQNVDGAIRMFFTDAFTSSGGLALGSSEISGYACQLQLTPLAGGFWHEHTCGNGDGTKGSGATYTTLAAPADVAKIYLGAYNNGKWLTFDETCRMAVYGWAW